MSTSDPRLDRRIEFDPRSRNFPIRALFTPESADKPIGEVRSYTWNLPEVPQYPLDQGREGACVGFSWAHEIAARPWADSGLSYDYAIAIYRWAQDNDEWPGNNYSGTSVLAGAKAVSEWLSRVVQYRWAFSLDDVVRTIAYKGPGVFGTNWYTGMMRPGVDGRIRPTGQVEGGHAILTPRVTGALYRVATLRRRVFVYNSWGKTDGWPWAWLTWDDFERLLHENGEFCIPVVRR